MVSGNAEVISANHITFSILILRSAFFTRVSKDGDMLVMVRDARKCARLTMNVVIQSDV